MSKKSIVITAIGIVILGVLGYFAYRYVFLKEEVNIFSLVPDSALLVYESSNISEDWQNLQGKELWETLRSIPSLSQVEEDVALLDTLATEAPNISKFFHNRPFLMSMHAVSKDQFDFLYVVEIDQDDFSIVNKGLKYLKESWEAREQKRVFNGLDIYELREANTTRIFTYIIENGHLIGSFSPLLVEDAIRNINSDFANSFLVLRNRTQGISGVAASAGMLHINLLRLPDYLSLFGHEKGKKNIVDHFGEVALLEVDLQGESPLFNGFTVAGASTKDTWLNTLKGQKPQALGFANLLPDRTSIFHHITFDNAPSWLVGLKQFWVANSPKHMERWDNFAAAYGLEQDDVFTLFDKEIGLAILESIEIQSPDKLAYWRCKEVERALGILDDLAEQASIAKNDTLYTEEYSGVKIRQLDLEEFPAMVLGEMFEGFETCYYMPIDDYVVIGNSVQVLKSLLNDIEREATWGKSVKYNEFLSNSIRESNYELMINTPKVWPMLLEGLGPKWESFAQENNVALKQLELIGLQFSNIDEDFYTSITLKQGPPLVAKAQADIMNVHHVYLDRDIITKPFIVKNHTNGNREVLLQDSAFVVQLISSEGRILWKDSVQAPIIGEVAQIDYYSNGKLQYFFVTENHVHVIDREGNYVSGFPLTLDYSVGFASVIDYDNSKRYRFLISDTRGNLYMYDKEGKGLEGWTPRSMDFRLSSAPGHLRVRGKDYIYAVQENGSVKVMNRRGEMYSGFPLKLEDKIISPLFIEIGSNSAQTRFTAITENGLLVQFNLEGKVLSREQLYKPSAMTTFRLVPGALNRGYVILRQDMRRVAILGRKGEVMFEKDYLSSEEMKAQYYYYNAENIKIAITDPIQSFTYIYDIAGNLISGQPIESDDEIGLLYFEGNNNFRLYSVYGRKFSLASF